MRCFTLCSRAAHSEFLSRYHALKIRGLKWPAGQPAIYLSWFDAWAFCQWARWQGTSCRLTWEDEWEYACKFGTPSHWNYWWGDEFNGNLANAEMSLGKTNVPDRRHVNPATRDRDQSQHVGLRDMLGNVWEWCRDRHRPQHSKQVLRQMDDATGFPVLRGGSFLNVADLCQSSCRSGWLPTFCGLNDGLRVARA